jgi:hypothetical protein
MTVKIVTLCILVKVYVRFGGTHFLSRECSALLHWLLFEPEDSSSKLPRNVDLLLPTHSVSHDFTVMNFRIPERHRISWLAERLSVPQWLRSVSLGPLTTTGCFELKYQISHSHVDCAFFVSVLQHMHWNKGGGRIECSIRPSSLRLWKLECSYCEFTVWTHCMFV